MAERRQVCRQVQEKGETGLVVSMGERLFNSAVAHVDWVQLPTNYPNLIGIPVNVIPYLYCSPIGLARDEIERSDSPLSPCRLQFIKARESPGIRILQLRYLPPVHWMDNCIRRRARNHHGILSMSSLTSPDTGIEEAVPGRVTDRPAVAQPVRIASTGSSPLASAAAKPPLNASPAPVVSTTGPALTAGTSSD